MATMSPRARWSALVPFTGTSGSSAARRRGGAVTCGGVPVRAHACAFTCSVATKRRPRFKAHALCAVGVWPAFGISMNVACANCRAASRPAELGALASRSPERTSTGTSGNLVPGGSGDRAEESLGQSRHCAPAGLVCVQPSGEKGQNACGSIAFSARAYAARRAARGSAYENTRGKSWQSVARFWA